MGVAPGSIGAVPGRGPPPPVPTEFHANAASAAAASAAAPTPAVAGSTALIAAVTTSSASAGAAKDAALNAVDAARPSRRNRETSAETVTISDVFWIDRRHDRESAARVRTAPRRVPHFEPPAGAATRTSRNTAVECIAA
jgi:hypothetical protein|tara:strand:+ start:1669 stop:2088 length:420 start_codon:yes stop_codon:yes gene_type:complete|mmetsp:Transcript_9018/g.33644  ORF Transcript_9018/g.33644 Transcript_9018/m.33644 type:complete len:140 (+) Transcript_9018:1213-1632(+)